jgi:hypothetical protein
MEMTGRPQDGIGWMVAREALWSTPAHLNRVHNWWHKALAYERLSSRPRSVPNQRFLREAERITAAS